MDMNMNMNTGQHKAFRCELFSLHLGHYPGIFLDSIEKIFKRNLLTGQSVSWPRLELDTSGVMKLARSRIAAGLYIYFIFLLSNESVSNSTGQYS
jgi:hypothetical protein